MNDSLSVARPYDPRSSRRLRLYSLACVVACYALLLWGGSVHATGSSLACPDWPLCYGELFPEMKGGVAIEHGHRLLATFVGMLSLGLLALSWRYRGVDRRLMAMSAAAVVLVILQGLAGGITVIYRLPTMVSTTHLALGSAFFVLLIAIAFRVWGLRIPADGRLPGAQRVGRLAVVGTILVYTQMILGALVRHTGAGLACNRQVLLCNGVIWPTGPDSGPAMLHMTHRMMGLVVAIYLIWAAIVAARWGMKAGVPMVSRWALAGPILVICQILLGMWTVRSFIDVTVVVAHLGGAEALLAQQASLALLCAGSGYRRSQLVEAEPATAGA